MISDELNKIRSELSLRNPIVHCITNPISLTNCANAILSVGARPIMAEHPQEVNEITSAADSLMLNLGNITDARMESALTAAKCAEEIGIPFLLDAVGIACSSLRHKLTLRLLDIAHPTVIKGNYSEITALDNYGYRSAGVDADLRLDEKGVRCSAVRLAKKYNSVILASGKTDIITDGRQLFCIRNGTAQLAQITGTGCMLGALCSAYSAVCRDIRAALCACAVLGICGELSQTDSGNASFGINLMDRLSVLTAGELKTYLKLEEMKIEKY